MYISQATFLHNRCENMDILRMAIGDNLYNHHQLLWTLFPNTQKGEVSFLFHRAEAPISSSKNKLQFIIVSQKEPVKPTHFWDIQSKTYTPIVELKDCFEFRIKINPTIAKKIEGKKNSKRHDVVMNRKCENKKINVKEPMNDIVYQEGLKWMDGRSEKNGFKLVSPNQTLIHSYAQHVLQTNNKLIRLSTLQVEGLLEVTNKESFKKMLFTGLGPAKGFGCGLMLIKRTSR